MRSYPFARRAAALGVSLVLAVAPPSAAAGAADSTLRAPAATSLDTPHYSAAACAAGFRLATIVRFPIGVGLGLAVCVTGIALDLDARLHRALD